MFFVHGRTARDCQRTLRSNTLLPPFDAVTIFTQTGTVHRRTFCINRAIDDASFYTREEHIKQKHNSNQSNRRENYPYYYYYNYELKNKILQCKI